jgi:hypothetical protein
MPTTRWSTAALALFFGIAACGAPTPERRTSGDLDRPEPELPREVPPDPLAGTLPRPEPQSSAPVRVYGIATSEGYPPVVVPTPTVRCEGATSRADPTRAQCSAETPCERWGCYAPGQCHGGARLGEHRGCTPGDCGDGEVCVRVEAASTCAVATQRCRPDCRAHGCGDGEVCGSDGACRPPDCRWEGERCGPNTHCRATAGWGYCLRRPCRSSRQCDCGVCVRGACHEQPGRCEGAIP